MSFKGFSLVEMMIAMSIMGILAAISFPSYMSYVTDGRRTEASAFLLEVMQKEERYFTRHLEYTTRLSQLNYSSDAVVTDSGYYRVTAVACTPNPCIKLTATPQGVQATRDNNRILTLDSLGRRSGDWND